MNILHITSTDLRGAGSAVTAINTLLNANGHHSRIVVVFKTKDDATITGMLPTLPKTMRNRMDTAILCFGKIQSRLTIEKAHPDYFFYNLDERKSNFTAKQILKKIAFKPDAIFVHWASRFVNTKEIRNLAELTAAQMFWVMIDNAPITGGCHYPYDCKGYETDCGNCPALLSDSKKHIAQRNFALKKANMPAGLHILTFSSMDKLRAEKSSMYANQTADVIFLPVNEQIFRPALTSDARRYFNLPEDRKIIFFAATDPNERRKGYAELCEALKCILMSNENTDEYMFATAGKNPPKSGGGNSLHARHLGYLSEQEMVLAFNAATLFVCPTLEDSGPGILGQAMLCGTPTVAFATGAAVDMIKTGYTGYLARRGDSADLAEGIKYVFNTSPEEYATMRKNCRETGMKTCSFDAVGERLEKLLTRKIIL